MQSETTQTNFNDICTAAEIVEQYPELFNKSQIDWLLKTRHKNGLYETGAVLMVSRKLYLKKSVFIDWFMDQKAN